MENHKKVDFPEIPAGGIQIDIPEHEVFKLLEDIDTHKATSSADFASWISKNNSHLLCAPVTDIINSILSTGKYPKLWKQAEVSPIPKTRNPTQCKDMRPISLLIQLGILAERVIAKHLRASLPRMTNQYAYTPSLGTTDALVKLTTDIITDLDCKNCIGARALMLDFSKAFDRMQPNIAIRKLLDININPILIRTIESFLSERSQCVKYGGKLSTYLPSYIGVPQGTILGPLLWNIYINGLAPKTNYVKYADDSTVYHPIFTDDAVISNSTSQTATVLLPNNPLQEAADYATSWCEQNCMLLNASKSNTITFTLRKQLEIDPISINSSEVEDNCSVKLLDVTFDQHLRFSQHVDSIIEKCRPAFHSICKLRKAGVNDSSLTLFYKARIIPLMIYAAPCWYPLLGKTDKERLDKYQRHCLRLVYQNLENSASRLETAGLTTVSVQLENQCHRYTKRIRSDNTHALHDYIHTGGRISSRSGRFIPARTRTALGSKNLFRHY